MARQKGKGKIHPQFLMLKTLNIVLREDKMSLYSSTPPLETPLTVSDDVSGLGFERQNPCMDLVVSHCSLDEPISVLTPIAAYPSCETPVITSGVSGGRKKRKRIGYNPSMKKKIKTLRAHLIIIPFSLMNFLDLESHKSLLTHLGLWDFLSVNFSKVIMPGLIEQLVANYNPKRPLDRTSFVNGYPVTMSHSAVASALRLPTNRKFLDQDDALESGVLVVSKEEALFVEELVWNYMVLQDAKCKVPDEVMRIISLVRDRKMEKVDWAGLIWFMMERELLKGVNLTRCYYASYMQSLVQHDSSWLFDDSLEKMRFHEMGSASRGNGHMATNQMQLLDVNENNNRKNDITNREFLKNSHVLPAETDVIGDVKTMDNAQLICCTTMKKPCLEVWFVEGQSGTKLETLARQNEVIAEVAHEDQMLIGDEIGSVHAKQALVVENQYKDLMTRLFDEAENEESEGMVNQGVCDANVVAVVETLQKEDDSMDKEYISWHAMDGNNDMHSIETSSQQDNYVITQNETSTEFLTDVVVEENTNKQVCISRKDEAIDSEHNNVHSTKVNLIMKNEVSADRLGPELGHMDHNVETSMTAAVDDDQHSSESTNPHSVLGEEDPITSVLNVLCTEIVCYSEKSVAMEVEHRNMVSTSGDDLMLAVLMAEKDVLTTDQVVCVGDVMELEQLHRLSTKVHKAGVTMDEAYANSENQEAGIVLAETKSIQGLVEKAVFMLGGEQNVQKEGETCGQFSASSPIHSVERNRSVNAIVLESDSEEEIEQQLNCIGGSQDIVFHNSSFQYVEEEVEEQSSYSNHLDMHTDTGPSEEQPLNLDSCANMRPGPNNIQPCLPYEVIIEDLKEQLAQQIRLNKQYEIQWHLEIQMLNKEISRYARELYLSDSLVRDYKKMIKEMDKSFAEHVLPCQQSEESKYRDHPDGNGLVITVAEWEKLVQERHDQENREIIQSMFEDFGDGCIVELEERLGELESLCDRVSVCGESVNMLKVKALGDPRNL